jgi:hypothetical protein
LTLQVHLLPPPPLCRLIAHLSRSPSHHEKGFSFRLSTPRLQQPRAASHASEALASLSLARPHPTIRVQDLPSSSKTTSPHVSDTKSLVSSLFHPPKLGIPDFLRHPKSPRPVAHSSLPTTRSACDSLICNLSLLHLASPLVLSPFDLHAESCPRVMTTAPRRHGRTKRLS